MKQLIFSGYPSTTRNSLVIFSSAYLSMINRIKSKLIQSKRIKLHLGRISDTGVSIDPAIEFFEITIMNENTFKAKYYSDHYNEKEQKIPLEKTIRFDNPFGELPILPGYEKMDKFLSFGDDLSLYKLFISDIREILKGQIGKNIELRYKNDDGSFSVISGKVKEVNRGNIFMEDYYEALVRGNKSVKVDLLVRRDKNHRFISERGYLCWVCSSNFNKESAHDEGEVFGTEETWNFSVEQVA